MRGKVGTVTQINSVRIVYLIVTSIHQSTMQKRLKRFLPFIVSFNLKRILQANVNTIAKFKVNFKQKVMMTQSCPGFPRNSVNYVEQKRRDQEREGVLYLALSK